MNNIGWGIIGVPDGFQHISQGLTANKNISVVDNRLCTEEYAEETLFAVIYDTAIVEGTNTRQLITYFVQYNFVKEIEKDRLGSFYGSYIAILGKVEFNLEGFGKIVELLKRLSEHNKDAYTENNKFVRDYNSIFVFPDLVEELKKITKNANNISIFTNKNDNKKNVVVCDNSPSEVFLSSVELYDNYSIIYISNSKEYCTYIEKDKNILYKNVLDLFRESSDIIENRWREEKRRKKEEQDKLEREINEKNIKLREEQEKNKEEEEDIKKNFRNIEEIFFYTYKNNAGIDKLIEEYRTGNNNNFEILEDISKSLKEYASTSSDIANFLLSKKLELDTEIVKLKSSSSQSNNELKLANDDASEFYLNNVTLKKPINSIKENNSLNRNPTHRGRPNNNIYDNNNNDSSYSDDNIFSGKNIIIVFLTIIILLILGFGTKVIFFDKNSKSTKLEHTTSPAKESDTVEPNNDSVQGRTEDESDLFSKNIQNDIAGFPTNCTFNKSLFETYPVSTTDVRDIGKFDAKRDDADIIAQITQSILSINGDDINMSEEEKEKFKKMLIDCNDNLNYSSINQEETYSLKIGPISKVRYINFSDF